MSTTSKADLLGPGSCKFGKTGSETEIAFQCTEIELSPETKPGDTMDFLSGTSLVGEAEKSFKLSGKLAQEYSKDSLLVWAKQNDGQVLPFVYRPSNKGELVCKGEVMIAAIKIGGTVKKPNESDFEFVGIGDWTLETTDPLRAA
ncbi:hypothetical protein [Rothia sp. L_38]|uniref:hypothetical protein n=1 Tax=Rothia sp. L_38 TaxID=3422315 RepID=UPI003D6BB2D3